MSTQDAFRTMVRSKIGPLLKDAGFRATAMTWRLSSAQGDVVLVNLQKSRWNRGEEINFYVNLAVVPIAWWQYQCRQYLDKPPANPLERHGLLRRRLEPPPDGQARREWLIHGAESADRCGEILRQQLDEVAIPELTSLLDRDRLISAIHNGGTGWWVVPKPELAMAYVMADQGDRSGLNEVLDAFDRTSPNPRNAEQAAWLRQRASGEDHDG